MTWAIALHEWRRLRAGMTFWLLLGFTQLIIAWLTFAQLETLARIAPQLRAANASLGAMELVVTPGLNSLVLLLLLAMPAVAMGVLAGEVRSGRIALWLSAPVGSGRIVLGKALGLWLGSLPLLATALATLAATGLGLDIDWPRFALAAAALLLFALWLACVTLLLSGLFDHPAAALAASYGVLLFLWLLDALAGPDAPWHWLALLPHLTPAFDGLLRSQDLLYFLATGGAALLLAAAGVARRRGELG